MSVLLEIKSLAKTYSGRLVPALDDVSLSVSKGEFVALTGPSGSGKTSLLRMVAGLLDADRGEVIFNKEKVKGPKCVAVPGHPDIKTVFQDFNLEPHLSIFDNVRVMLRAYKPDYALHRSEVLLKTVGLWHDKDKRPDVLSGGQQQRLSIARALAEDPALLLMDEPFSNLDRITKDALKQEIKKHAAINDTTVLFVTHDPLDALAMAHRVVYMQNGKIIQADTPEAVYQHPATESVAAYFGDYSTVVPGEAHKPGGLRPEYVSVSDTGMPVKIVYSEYRGGMYLHHARSEAGSLMKFFAPRQLSKNELLHLSIDEKMIFELR